MPPIENGQNKQRNYNGPPANGFGVGSGNFGLHYLNPVEGLGTLLIELVNVRSELGIIESLLFFVK